MSKTTVKLDPFSYVQVFGNPEALTPELAEWLAREIEDAIQQRCPVQLTDGARIVLSAVRKVQEPKA